MTTKSAAKPTRATQGYPKNFDFDTFWRRKIWTREQARRAWPTRSQLLISPKTVLNSHQVHALVDSMEQYDAAAFECLQWARWGDEAEDKVCVRCPKCNKPVWSHGATGAKHRWRCVTKKMYEAHQTSKNYQVGAHSRNGCGYQFNETKGTPFHKMKAPVGLVFFALYFPARQIEKVLRTIGKSETARELSKVLTVLKQEQYAELAASVRELAKVFSGTLFLEYHGALVSRRGKDLFEEKVGTEGEVRWLRNARRESWKGVIRNEYNAIRSYVDRLERMDSALAQRNEADPLERERMYQGLAVEIRRIASGSWFVSDSPSVAGEGVLSDPAAVCLREGI